MNENDYEIPMFDYKEFIYNYSLSDLSGIEYIGKTIIRDFKDRINDNIGSDYTYYDYIINLYNATRSLNECVFIYEMTSVKNNFKYDLYCGVRDLLFSEIGLDLEDVYKKVNSLNGVD